MGGAGWGGGRGHDDVFFESTSMLLGICSSLRDVVVNTKDDVDDGFMHQEVARGAW